MMLASGDFQDWVMVQVVSHSISLRSTGSFTAQGYLCNQTPSLGSEKCNASSITGVAQVNFISYLGHFFWRPLCSCVLKYVVTFVAPLSSFEGVPCNIFSHSSHICVGISDTHSGCFNLFVKANNSGRAVSLAPQKLLSSLFLLALLFILNKSLWLMQTCQLEWH